MSHERLPMLLVAWNEMLLNGEVDEPTETELQDQKWALGQAALLTSVSEEQVELARQIIIDCQVVQLIQRWSDAKDAGESINPAEGVTDPEILKRLKIRIQNARKRNQRVHDVVVTRSPHDAKIEWAMQHFADHPTYAIEEPLGAGGMGTVLKARQRGVGDRVVALKVIDSQNNRLEALRFQREIEILAQPPSHPNVVPVYDCGEWNKQPFYTMEPIPGGRTLNHLPFDRLDTSPSLWCRMIAGLVACAAEGVDHAHVHKAVHRDLKPANFLLAVLDPREQTNDDPINRAIEFGNRVKLHDHFIVFQGFELRPMLSDFGLASIDDHHSIRTNPIETIGTFGYIAPELWSAYVLGHKCLPPSTRADVFSLGIMLFKLSFGYHPHRDAIHELNSVKGLPKIRWPKSADADYKIIIKKCLEEDPDNRYKSVRELSNDLRSWFAGEPIVARPPRFWEQQWRTIKKRKLLTGVYMLTVVTAVMAIWQWQVATFERDAKDGAIAEANFRRELADHATQERTIQYERAEKPLNDQR